MRHYVMRFTVLALFWAFCFSLTGIYAQETNSEEANLSTVEMLEKASDKINDMEEASAIELYEQVLDRDPDNFEALWNLSILYIREGFRQEEESDMQHYYEKAKELAEKTLELYPDEADAHFVYAVALGRMTDILTPRERVRSADEIREHAAKAIEIDPDHEGAWHVLGVWHKNAANLTRAERWAANLLFGGAPEGASNDEAESALKKAIELDENNILFLLDLAKLYLVIEQEEDAKQILEVLLDLEPRYQDDPGYLEEAGELLRELS